jgi:hypothetical protein
MKTREIRSGEVDVFGSSKAAKPFKFDESIQEEIQKARKSPAQERHDTIKDDEVTIKRRETSEVEDPMVNSSSSPGKGWIRQNLPSLMVPYDTKEIFVKPLDIAALSMIHAANKSESISILLDAVDPYINVDVRNLTPTDFEFYLFWLRENSYKKYPHKFQYTTRYGNTIDVEIRMSNLEINELNMTQKEFNGWKEKGICFPTMRDAELIENSDDFPEDRKWLLEQAQFVPIPEDLVDNDEMSYVEKKIEALNRGGLALYEDIVEFKKHINHGLVETLEIVDTSFDPQKAIEYFRKEARELAETVSLMEKANNEGSEEEVDNSDTEDNLMLIRMASLVKALFEEADNIEESLNKGEKVTPTPEVVPVAITATSFFPAV